MDGYGDVLERVSNQVVDSIYENRDREKFYYLHFATRSIGQEEREWTVVVSQDRWQIGAVNRRF